MTRQYANIFCAIWDDPEFCALTAGAQRTYFMLVTQTEITACGSLALTLRRWSRTCADNDIDVWLKELSHARFVLIDEDTEELLVRTFVKHDGGYKHAKRVLAVIAHAKAIRSSTLRAAVASELAKLGVPIGNPVPTDSQSDGNQEAFGSGRSVVTEGEYNSTPESTIQEGGTSTASGVGPPSMFCSRHPNGTEQPCGACADARKRLAAHTEAKLASEVAARKAAADARAACPLCDEHGKRIDPKTKLPIGRCDHQPQADA